MDEHGHHYIVSWIGNSISVGVIYASVMGILPAVAAIAAIIWYYIQISESQTVRHWKARRLARKIAKVKAQLVLLEAEVPHHEKPALPLDDG